MNKTTVELATLDILVQRALINLGVEAAEAGIVKDVLMYAEKRGSSQGLIKIKERTVLPDPGCRPVDITRKTPAMITIDGGGHTGMYVLHQAVEAARSAIATCGIALVSTSNTRSSTGSIGFYARQLADDGYIAIVLAGSPKVMAIEGGIDPLLGTNPIAIAIPTTDTSLVFDSATAAITWFSVIHARDNHQQLPEGVAIDKHGTPTTNPVAAMQGALRTVAGAKGSALALMIEFLTASLADTSIAGDAEDNRGNTLIAIDPTRLLGEQRFYRNADRLIERVKASRSGSNTPVRLPGEASDSRAAQCESCLLYTSPSPRDS